MNSQKSSAWIQRGRDMSFPKDFVWGAAAASYQIEGGAFADGKGLSVWDSFCASSGKVVENHTGEVSCDHYHRYQEDVDIMAEIGLKAYRLSISWPRVLPNGIGKVNEAGLDFYDRLVDSLLAKGIDPWVTLFHWDFPQELYYKGGWLNRDSADWFAEYTSVIVDKLSDRVTNYMPQNEPQCFIGLGHMTGVHAPGLVLTMPDVLRAAHNSLLANGKSVQVIRAQAKKKPSIGTAFVGVTRIPKTNSPEDIEAARKCMFSMYGGFPWNNTWFSDPMIFGRYPQDGIDQAGSSMPKIAEGDMETIKQPLDFYGFNSYTGTFVQADGENGFKVVLPEPGYPQSAMGWGVFPEALYWGPKFFYEHYKLPVVVTENGMANCDIIDTDGKVHDPQRIKYLSSYLEEYRRAIEDGAKGIGYFQWSIMDNFEWAEGYRKRFGIVYVDYKDQKRVLKDSAYWYKDTIASNGESL